MASVVPPVAQRGAATRGAADRDKILGELAAVANAMSRAMVITSCSRPDAPILFANAAFAALTGYETHEIVGRDCRFLQGSDTDPEVVREIGQAVSEGRSIRRMILNYRKNGESFWNDLLIDPIHNGSGELCGFVGTQYHGEYEYFMREARRDVQHQFAGFIGNVPGYLYRRIMKPDGLSELAYISAGANRILGVPEDQNITTKMFFDRMHPDDAPRIREALERSGRELTQYNEEFRLLGSDDSVCWLRSQSQPRRLPNGVVIWDGLALDITAEKQSQEKIEFLALHDPLTGLANRDQFRGAILHAVNLSLASKRAMALFVIDLHEFQDINDAMGIAAGDSVLRIMGRRLAAFANDINGTAARLGGDVFGVLIPDMAGPLALDETILALQQDIARVIKLPELGDFNVAACIGVARFPFAESGFDAGELEVDVELLKRADVALQAAKQDGPCMYREYTPELDDRVRARLVIRQSLQTAIAEQQFQLYYQPIVNLKTGRIVSAEALVRWKHPQLGFQRPDLFIPLAESTGLIVPLGAWIMSEAMRQGMAWRREGIQLERIAINISSVELKRPTFMGAVEQALAATGADARHFEFELTESLLIDASPEIFEALQRLKALGFTIAIDDFGTGHSTFKYLHDFHVDKIKIDQTFVKQLVVDSKDSAIIRAMIALSRDLALGVVAEGIETQMQRDFLRQEGCEIGQGYYFSMPLAAEDFAYIAKEVTYLPVERKRESTKP